SSQAGYQLWSDNYGATGGGGNVFAFENPANWSTAEGEPAPPAFNTLWQGENNQEDIILVLTDERSGENGTEKLGTFTFGGESGTNDFNSKFTFIINNSVTYTAQETDGGVIDPPGTRSIRIGRENINPLGTLAGGTTETAPWGIVKVQHGTFKYDDTLTNGIDMSRDKPNAAGAIFEVNGDGVLDIEGPVRFGDRDNGGVRSTPGAIFRMRGSNASAQVEDFLNESRLGLWDHDNDITADNPFGVTHMNLGKFVTEFVLDAGGASTIVVNDELRLGRSEDLDATREFGYAFLRIKLSEPTTAGSGAVGSGNEIVLFQADRVSSAIDADNDPNTTIEIEEGRFFDPDRAGFNSSGTSMLPHAGLWDGGTVRADYAGAQYQWTINYFDSSDDGIVIDAVTLSNLQIVGTPGDLSGNSSLGSEDRQLLVDAIASPPEIAIATAQNLFDLNADEVVDALDLAVFDAYFPGLGLTASVSAPEPASASLLALALLSIGVRRRY
ncbi:MAG: hypothetical protein KDA37_16995, partial [Planctomycetales bacterium]|nr:hypothetical protein [Planctomycetales bacterium]